MVPPLALVAAMMGTKTRYFALRLTRHGPLVPGRIRFIDHEPGIPDNHRDRWPALLCLVDIAGESVPPENLIERFHWPPGHWKHPRLCSAAEYRWRFETLRWAEEHQPDHPVLRPRRRIDPRAVALPDFNRENAHVGKSTA